jgi:hypothetical protein
MEMGDLDGMLEGKWGEGEICERNICRGPSWRRLGRIVSVGDFLLCVSAELALPPWCRWRQQV